MGIFLRQGDGFVLREQEYEAETVLQKLIAEHPEVLVGERDLDETTAWLLVKREASIVDQQEPGRGMTLDHLYLDEHAVPTFVEVKRRSDTRIRREVIGQILDYAANAPSYWDVGVLQGWFNERCSERGVEPDQALRAAFPAVDDIAAYWEQVSANLDAGRLRLVIVADAIPGRLARLVEYLNEQMANTEVLAIEVKQYVDGGGSRQTIVPRVIGQTEAARQKRSQGQVWDRDSILAALTERGGPGERVAQGIFDWFDHRGDLKAAYGTGKKDGSFQAGLYVGDSYPFPFALYTYGSLEIQFQWIRRRPPFDNEKLRDELRSRLNQIEGVELAPDTIERRPAISLETLAEADKLRQALDAFDWAYERFSESAAS
jgi:hypothetical protein